MNSIIRRFTENINTVRQYLNRTDVFISILIIGVGTTSFFLGILYVQEQQVPNIKRSNALATLPAITPESAIVSVSRAMAADGKITASRNGTKYYFAWCSGAGKIALKNRIFFNTEVKAQTKGYSLAKGCVQ